TSWFAASRGDPAVRAGARGRWYDRDRTRQLAELQLGGRHRQLFDILDRELLCDRIGHTTVDDLDLDPGRRLGQEHLIMPRSARRDTRVRTDLGRAPERYFGAGRVD